MDENLINQTIEEYDVTEDIDVVEVDVPVEDIEAEIPVEETVYDVTVESEEEVAIDISESMGWVSGDDRYHDSLLGVDNPNQHPITAIKGLQEKLDKIEALKTVYSDKPNTANYYEWQDATYNEYGYFVSLVPGTSKIGICNGSEIFGVSVDTAGFVGGQDANIPKDNKYGLIVTSGLVSVRCELDVEVGDHIISNSRGYARKSDTEYGYTVIAKEDKDDVEYAIIILGVQADVVNSIGGDLKQLQNVTDVHGKNIVSAINVANQAYKKSSEAVSVSEGAVKEALEAVLRAENAVSTTDEINQALASTNSVATQARAIAESAATSAVSLKNEAVTKANDAWAKADEVATEAHSLCAKIDKYSVGEYSQAYGLTLEQAQVILEMGMIYVPTRHIDSELHKEQYAYDKDGGTQIYEREFVPGYLYQWDYIPNNDVGVGWLTIGESPSVYFANVEPTINDRLAYWYTDGDVITDVNKKTDTYEPYTLYKWEGDHWLAVATLKGNSTNRAVSMMSQTTNRVAFEVFDARGSFAGMQAEISETNATVASNAFWKNDDGSQYVATFEQKADGDGSSLALIAHRVNTADGVEQDASIEIKGASIVLGQSEDDGSYISIGADAIDLHGYITANGAFSIDEQGSMTASGGNIGGWNITPGAIFKTVEIEAGHWRNVTLTTQYKYDDERIHPALWFTNSDAEHADFRVDWDGTIRATKGSIGNWTLDQNRLINYGSAARTEVVNGETKTYYDKSFCMQVNWGATSNALAIGTVREDSWSDANFVVTHEGHLTANSVNIEGVITSTDGHIGSWGINQEGLFSDLGDTGIGLWSTTAHDNIAIHAGANTQGIGTAPFRVYHDGTLYCEKLNAMQGTIGGFTIGTEDKNYNGLSVYSNGTALEMRNDGTLLSRSLYGQKLYIYQGGLGMIGSMGSTYMSGSNIVLKRNDNGGRASISVDGNEGKTGYVTGDHKYLLFRGGVFVGVSTTKPTDLSSLD